MTDAEAMTLKSGDRIRLTPRIGNTRAFMIVLRVEVRRGQVEIIDIDGFSYVPWEVDRVEMERRP